MKGARRWLGGPRSLGLRAVRRAPRKPCGLENSRFVTGRRPSSSSNDASSVEGWATCFPRGTRSRDPPRREAGDGRGLERSSAPRRRSASLGRWKISGSRGTCAGPARMLARRPTVLCSPGTSIGSETAPWRSSARALQRAVRCTARVERRARITSQAMRRDPVMTASCRERRASDTRPGVRSWRPAW